MAKKRSGRRAKRYKKRRINKKKLLLLIVVVVLFIVGVFKLTQGVISSLHKINNKPINQSTTVENKDNTSEVLNTEVDKNINKKYTILIDPGHGGNDKGTIASDNTTFEKDITLKIATLIAQNLSKQDDVEAVLSRTTDVKVSLAERARDANKKNVDLFVSIHLNGQTGGNDAVGLETYYTKLRDDGSDKLAKSIQETVTSYVEVRDRGVKTAKFQVLQESKMPGVLIECGFLSNKEEAKKLSNTEYQEKLAEGIAQGIFTYLDEKESN